MTIFFGRRRAAVVREVSLHRVHVVDVLYYPVLPHVVDKVDGHDLLFLMVVGSWRAEFEIFNFCLQIFFAVGRYSRRLNFLLIILRENLF